MKSELTLAFNEIAEHNKLKREIILDALESALVTAYRKAVNASTAQHVVAKVDPLSGQIHVFAEKEVVDKVQEFNTEVALDDARKVDPGANLGDMVTVESTPTDFGRIAAQAAKQVILQKLREAERESQYQEYAQREGDIVNGTVQAVNSQSITVGLGRTEATLPRNQTIPGERYHPHQKVRAFVLEVRKTNRGPQIILSRSHRNMLRRLFEYEVPEIFAGTVEIKSIAREPGHRSKVAVAARQDGVDPVGACVGMRGVRIQSIVKELNDEKIDVIEWDADQSKFILKSLSPARVTAVYLDDDPISGRTAMVVVPDDQLSLAIGREGQNARLAAKLTNWRIDIKSLSEAAGDAIGKLQSDNTYENLAKHNADMIAAAQPILARKAEGKVLAPEDYTLLTKLVDMVEKRIAKGRQEERAVKVEKVAAIKATIPAGARKMLISAAGFSDHLYRLLLDAEFKMVGEIMEKLAIDEGRFVADVDGMTNKDLTELKAALEKLQFPTEPEPAPEPVAVVVAKPEAKAAELPADAKLAEAVVEAPVAEPEVVTEEIEEDFTAKDSDEDDDDDKGKKKGKKKSSGAMEVTFDEDLGVYVTRKKRKPGRLKDMFLDE